jgi:hypothetical protein
MASNQIITQKLPRTVVMLGLVSFAMDVSSEMIHALLPLFLVTVLGASALSWASLKGLPKRLPR